MKLPQYNEIIFDDDDTRNMLNVIQTIDNKSGPYLLNLNMGEQGCLKFLRLLEEHIFQNGLSPFFPYPIFVLSKVENYKGIIKILSTRNQMPLFFRKIERSLNQKEQSILAKNLMLAQRVANHKHQDYTNKVQNFSQQHRKMYIQAFEGNFLEELIKKIRGFE